MVIHLIRNKKMAAVDKSNQLRQKCGFKIVVTSIKIIK